MKTRYVVAVSAAEASALAKDFGWDRIQDAIAHLTDAKSPPTDPEYANLYKVYSVDFTI